MTDNVLRERLTEPLSDILEALELAGYVVVKRERWDRVRVFAECERVVQSHKREVFAKDTFVHSEVEAMNARLKTIYAELETAYDNLLPGDLAPMGGER